MKIKWLDFQEKVYEEQKNIFGESKRSATSKDFTEMKYLERVLKETLRFYPSAPVIGRKITDDLPLSKSEQNNTL